MVMPVADDKRTARGQFIHAMRIRISRGRVISSADVMKAIFNPLATMRYITAIVKGRRIQLWCRLTGKRFYAGSGLQVYGRIIIRGPGIVRFGDNVVVDRVVTPWTYSRQAIIDVGSNSYLNGTKFSCKEAIIIGRDAILSDVSINDTNFHSTHVNRRDPNAPVRTERVVIGQNVWISAAAGLMPGTQIGCNSVVGYGAVCAGKYPPNSIIAGNPAVVIKAVPGALVNSEEGNGESHCLNVCPDLRRK